MTIVMEGASVAESSLPPIEQRRIYSEAGGEDRFAPAAGAAAGTGHAGPLAEDKAAILAGGGLQDEAPRAVARQRLDDVPEVVFDQPFRLAHELGELPRGQPPPRQHLDEPLSYCSRLSWLHRLFRDRRSPPRPQVMAFPVRKWMQPIFSAFAGPVQPARWMVGPYFTTWPGCSIVTCNASCAIRKSVVALNGFRRKGRPCLEM